MKHTSIRKITYYREGKLDIRRTALNRIGLFIDDHMPEWL